MPIATQYQYLQCGCAVVDLQTGRTVAFFDFVSGIDELFDIQILPGISSPFVSGPFADKGTESTIWTVPPPSS